VFQWFGSLEGVTMEFTRLRKRLAPWIRVADVVFVLTVTTMAARFLWQDRPGTATPMLILALAYLVTMVVIEPFTTERAFDFTCTAHPDVRQDGPGACTTCGSLLVPRDRTKNG
jgi:hypothetical protein